MQSNAQKIVKFIEESGISVEEGADAILSVMMSYFAMSYEPGATAQAISQFGDIVATLNVEVNHADNIS